MTVRLLAFCVLAFALANPNDQTQIEKYSDKIKSYKLPVPGKEPITIIETETNKNDQQNWVDLTLESKNFKDIMDKKNSMTDIIHDADSSKPRCYGPSCQEGFVEDDGPQDSVEDFMDNVEKMKDFSDFSHDRLQAINALAAKLKTSKYKGDRYYNMDENTEPEDNTKVYTSWNKLKVKQHKHPYDDRDGWVTLEPVAWSTSKISKWKPNVKKQKPSSWIKDEDRYPDDDKYVPYEGVGNTFEWNSPKRPSSHPAYINNKLHMPSDYEPEIPSRPTWNKPQQTNYNSPHNNYNLESSWMSDDSRRPQKPSCDSDRNNNHNEDSVYYGTSDSLVTDLRPSNFPYEHEALHQASMQKRPIRRPTQVVYAGTPEYEDDRSSRPPFGDGQWVLLSTTRGYKNKKRQRSLNPSVSDSVETPSITSHQAVALTVLPMESAHTNMTTSHGGLLEVEKSFQTVEESKRDMDKLHDLDMSASNYHRPSVTKVIKRKVVQRPDSSTILAAVGAGMVPATMAMVVPMMLGRRRRKRDTRSFSEDLHLDNIFKMQ